MRRQQLDRRYQSVRLTISRQDIDQEPSSSNINPSQFETNSDRPTERNTNNRSEFDSSGVITIPAVLFLSRPDFFTVLHTNADAMELYNRNSSLKHIINRIRRDSTVFPRYEHNRDLVVLVNLFADVNKDLPVGYESKLDRNGKVSFPFNLITIVIKFHPIRIFIYNIIFQKFFINHMRKTTSFIDPRLPTEATHPRTSAEEVPLPPPRTQQPVISATAVTTAQPDIPVAYNDKVVAFLRQPNIMDILKERHSAFSQNVALKEKINTIRVEGSTSLQRLGHDVPLALLLRYYYVLRIALLEM